MRDIMNLRHLKRSWLLSVALILFLFGNNANAWYVSKANPTSVGPIQVILGDGAKDACWTNLKEVREYTEEKLRNKGYSVTTKDALGYMFDIAVDGFRLDNGNECVWHAKVSIYKTSTVAGLFGFHEIGADGGYGINPKNVNNAVISLVQKLIDKM
jgi:hypothetical protein